MFWDLIATVVAGMAAAGAVWLVKRTFGGFGPAWLTPVVAGAAMLAMTIYNEYNWQARTTAALPDGFEVTLTRENRAWFRPWTYIRPFTDGFIALDAFNVQRNASDPDLRLVTLYVYGRYAPLQPVPVLFHCTRPARVDGATPPTTDAEWRPVDPTDATLQAACAR